jgi:hypothetical protein
MTSIDQYKREIEITIIQMNSSHGKTSYFTSLYVIIYVITLRKLK